MKGSIATEGSFTEKDRPRDSVIRFDVDHEKVDDGVDSDDSVSFDKQLKQSYSILQKY